MALGCQQVAGEDFKETYSPTVQADSLRLTVAIASKFNWDLKQLENKSCLLECKFGRKKIYTKIPYGDKNFNINKFWLLKKKKALYGLKQAGRMWYKEISHYFSKYKF